MYNEASVCADCAKTLSGAMKSLCADKGWDWEVLFCDDGSNDGCASIIEKLEIDGVRVLGYPDNKGKGRAVREAVLATEGDVVIYTDCDLAYGTDVIGEAVEKLLESGADMLLGSRNIHRDGYLGYTAMRKFASKVYIKVIAIYAGFKMTDSQCGFKAFRGECARKIFSHCIMDGFSFDLEVIKVAQKLKLKLIEMPVKIVNHRESKVNLVKDAMRMLRDIKTIKKSVSKLDV